MLLSPASAANVGHDKSDIPRATPVRALLLPRLVTTRPVPGLLTPVNAVEFDIFIEALPQVDIDIFIVDVDIDILIDANSNNRSSFCSSNCSIRRLFSARSIFNSLFSIISDALLLELLEDWGWSTLLISLLLLPASASASASSSFFSSPSISTPTSSSIFTSASASTTSSTSFSSSTSKSSKSSTSTTSSNGTSNSRELSVRSIIYNLCSMLFLLLVLFFKLVLLGDEQVLGLVALADTPSLILYLPVL